MFFLVHNFIFSSFSIVRKNDDGFCLFILHSLDVWGKFFSGFAGKRSLQKLCCPKDELTKEKFPNLHPE